MEKKKFKVLVPELVPPGDKAISFLESIAVIKAGSSRVYTEEELVKEARDVDAILVTGRGEKITRKVMEASEKLRVVSKYGVGVDNIDVKAATEMGIIVTRTPGANANAVAEFAVAMILAATRKIPLAMAHLKAGGWREQKLVGVELASSTVGLVGLGHIGFRVAKKLKGLDAKVLGYDPYVTGEKAAEVGVELAELERLLRESDVVTIHAALTEQTKHLIGERELALMKPSAYLVNTARGAIVDQKALYRALKEGRIAGAALDVFEEEPLKPDNPLFQLDNVILTPHVGDSTVTAKIQTYTQAAENILKVLRGELPPRESLVNPDVLAKTGKLKA